MKAPKALLIGTVLALSSLNALPAMCQDGGSAMKSGAAVKTRMRIAVDQFKIEAIQNDVYRIPADTREGMQSLLVQKLIRTGQFEVMDREMNVLQSADNETLIDRQNRGASQTAPTHPLQSRVAARFIITPTVIGFSVEKKGGTHRVGPISFGDESETATVRVNIRISDVQTSSVIASDTAEGSQTTHSKSVGINFGSISSDNKRYKESAAGQAIEKALEQAVTLICDAVKNAKFTAGVVKQDENTNRVIINAGASSGVVTGMQLAVYRRSPDVRDDDTGVVIPGDEVLVGAIRIVRAEAGYAFGDVVLGSTFKKGDVARSESAGAGR